MQIRVVTLRYNEAQQGFPEEAWRSAMFGREESGTRARQDSGEDLRDIVR